MGSGIGRKFFKWLKGSFWINSEICFLLLSWQIVTIVTFLQEVCFSNSLLLNDCHDFGFNKA